MENNNTKFPTKKDMTYWIIIIAILLTVVSVWKTNEPETLTNQLSLGGTLLSIFLAIIAIIFSFIQSSDTSSHNKDMILKMNEIAQNMKYLNELNSNTTEEIMKKTKNLNEIDNLINEIAEETINTSELTNDNKLNELSKKIEIAKQSIFFGNDISTQLTVLGEEAILNYIRKNFYDDKLVSLQVLWNNLYEENLRLHMSDLKNIMKNLSSKGKIILSTDENGGTYFKLKK